MLYGRDPERAVIGALLDAARESRSGALVLRGEPGIGKTALLADARERAADMQVLTARGVESESELPFAALHQLLRPALGDLDGVPGPQATALRNALGLADGEPPERFLVFAACLSLLSELAERRPVLCLVDDAHWLDALSADALRFVARRLDAEGILLLFGAREGDVARFEAADVESLSLAGLDAEAAEALMARDGGVCAAEPVLRHLVERTGGNALALLELPSVLTEAQLAGSEPLPDALPLTREMERAFLGRVRRLPSDSQTLLLVAAADDSERTAVVAAAAGRLGAGPDALDAAENAGLVAVRGPRLTFRHPLVRSAVYEAATSTERRAAHRALADALAADAERADSRAWHLAASAIDPDEGVVQALEAAAQRAGERGAHAAAAKALERAADLSADDQSRGRRLVAAARAASLGGADEYGSALARRAGTFTQTPELNAEIARVLGLAEVQRGRPGDVAATLVGAARGVLPVDPRKALELLQFAVLASLQGGDEPSCVAACELATTIDPSDDDDEQAFVVLCLAGVGAMITGDTAVAAPRLEAALERAPGLEDPLQLLFAALAALWLGDDDRMAAMLERGIRSARARGAIGPLTELLAVRSSQLLLAQRFDGAALAATEALRFAREVGAENLAATPLTVLAYLSALRGDDGEAARQVGEALDLATARGLHRRAEQCAVALGFLDLCRGRWTEALARLGSVRDPLLMVISAPDRIEAAMRAGRPDDARAALAAFEPWAEHSGAAWARPRLASCRALVADGQTATAHFAAALRMAADARPLDLARIRLLYGEHLRRQRRRVDSREQLRAALEGFDRLGATPWAERARAELRASGETASRRDPSAASTLTPQERQVARFVAEGLSNKEVAAQLYLSPRTIDSHLRNAFAKLGVTSRTQLARLPLDDDAPMRVR